MTIHQIVPENHGTHLRALIERTGCGIHKVPNGVPCHVLPNNVNPEADYVAACGSRIKKGGFIGRISAQSMRNEAPKKGGHGAKRPFKKKAHQDRPSDKLVRGKK
jgi:hypothetical protein